MTTKADLLKKLEGFGEKPPTTWTVLQLRGRLSELKEEEKAGRVKTLEGELNRLKKAAGAKKANLLALVKELDPNVSENLTIQKLFNLGEELITKQHPPKGRDNVGFGKYGYLTYQQLKVEHPAYCQWVATTRRESDSPHWRLVRLATWLEQMDSEEVVPGDAEGTPPSSTSPPRQRRDGASPSSPAMTKMAKEKAAAEKELADAKATIEALTQRQNELEGQIQDNRRQQKSRKEM